MSNRTRLQTTTTLLSITEVIKIAKNQGKLFEQDFQKSIPSTCWIYRLRDNASSFANGSATRFTSSNICDYILFDDISKTLFLIECKSTQGTAVPLSMVRDNQIKGLVDASKHNLIAGILINFRNDTNNTYFISIDNYVKMVNDINKKSFNIKDLLANNAIEIYSSKKRTRYTYDIQEMINKMKEETGIGNGN